MKINYSIKKCTGREFIKQKLKSGIELLAINFVNEDEILEFYKDPFPTDGMGEIDQKWAIHNTSKKFNSHSDYKGGICCCYTLSEKGVVLHDGWSGLPYFKQERYTIFNYKDLQK